MAELIKVNVPVRKPLFEGVQGENESRSIQFDITPWVEELGDGAVTATAKRSQDSQPYPVTVTKDGNTVTWKPTSTDTAFAGVGSFQLEYTVDDVLAKTCIWSTMVAPSLDPAGDPPDPYDNWMADLREIEASAIQAAEDAINKIPYPVNPDSRFGTSGQLLRTKGDGNTEWSDVGLPTDEQTAQAVTDWLDEHPEATTTVQDGSVTKAKLSNELQTKIDSISSDMSASPFEHINNQDLLNCIYTWVDARNELSYGNDSTTEHVAVDGDGYKEIDCSLFVWYVCMGIKYSDSIYGGGSNTSSYYYAYPWDGILDMAHEMGFNRVLANVQAKYCKERGYLFQPHTDLSDLQYGDLLFYDNAVMPSFWENIGHVAVYLYTTTYGDIVVAEAREGNDGHAIFINNSFDTSRINYVARLPIYSLKTIQQKNLVKNSVEIVRDFNTTITSSYTIATCELNEPTVEGRLYTAVVQLSDAPPSGYYVAVQLVGASALSARVLRDNEDHTFQLPFSASVSGATQMNIMLYAPEPSSQTFKNRLEFGGLYKGIHNLITPTASTTDVYDQFLAQSAVGDWAVSDKCKYRKYGRIVEVIMSAVPLTSTYTTVLSLPVGFRPTDAFYTSSTGFAIYVSVYGNVQVCREDGVAISTGNAHFVFLT